MLVEPAVRRHEAARLVPVDDDLLLALLPHDGEALAAGDDDDASRSVAVPFLVRPGREDGHMRAQLGARYAHVDGAVQGAASGTVHQLVPHAHVREEVAEPERAPGGALGYVLLGRRLGLGVEVLPTEHVFLKGVIEEEVRVGDGGHCDREVVVVQQARGPVALHVVELRPRVARDEEKAARRPLERVRLAVAAPDGRRALSAGDVDHLVYRLLERLDGTSGWHFLHAPLHNAGHPLQLDEGGVAIAQAPMAEFDVAQVLDVVAAVYGYPLAVHPAVVGEVLGHGVPPCFCGAPERGRFAGGRCGAYHAAARILVREVCHREQRHQQVA